MFVEKTGKIARTVNGLRPINIYQRQKFIDVGDGDVIPAFDQNDNPFWDGYEVAAVDAVGAPQIRKFGEFTTIEDARQFASTLPNVVD